MAHHCTQGPLFLSPHTLLTLQPLEGWQVCTKPSSWLGLPCTTHPLAHILEFTTLQNVLIFGNGNTVGKKKHSYRLSSPIRSDKLWELSTLTPGLIRCALCRNGTSVNTLHMWSAHELLMWKTLMAYLIWLEKWGYRSRTGMESQAKYLFLCLSARVATPFFRKT